MSAPSAAVTDVDYYCRRFFLMNLEPDKRRFHQALVILIVRLDTLIRILSHLQALQASRILHEKLMLILDSQDKDKQMCVGMQR